MLNISSLYFLSVVSLFICACQTIPWFGGDNKTEVDADEMKKNQEMKEEQLKLEAINKVDEFNLKLAKLWSKVDEQETRLLRQEEKIRLLEKGLMLGIVPEELLAGKKEPLVEISTLPTKPAHEAKKDLEATDSKNTGSAKLSKLDEEKETKPALESGAYRELLKSAQEKFNAANYGQAIAIYQKIGENFPKETRQGQHLYWIGVSWYYLKEYQLASDALNNLTENYPEGPLTGQTRLFLARIDIKNGLRKKALERLRNIIADFSNDEVGQMARYELSRLEESL